MTTAKSSPATTTAPDPHPTPSATNVPTITEATTAVNAAEPTTSQRNSLIFPLALTVLAVLPIALGIGAARLKASASSTAQNLPVEDEHEEIHEDVIVLDRRLGDRDFMARRYEVALQYYQSLGCSDPSRLPPELLYRIGLCQEGLGNWKDALSSLRGVSGSAENANLKAAADFGQARIHLRLNEASSAMELLRSLELHSPGGNGLRRNMSREIAFLMPIAMGHGSSFAKSAPQPRQNCSDGRTLHLVAGIRAPVGR